MAVNELPISQAVWSRLVETNRRAVLAGWAAEGVFGTGIGPEYQRRGAGSLLYIGKSAGPLGHAVGSCNDQLASCAASTQWMVDRKNKSAFWQFVDKIDPTRRKIAWTNICKMDRKGGDRPPNESEWSQVSDACMAALADEIASLSPHVMVFATSGIYQTSVSTLLNSLRYREAPLDFADGWTSCYRSPEGRYAILTKHPQGWDRVPRDRIIAMTVRLMSGG
jgi:hypothetical protein